LIPIATNPREREQVQQINQLAMKAIKKKQEASNLASEAVASVDTFIPRPAPSEAQPVVPGMTEFEKFQAVTQMLLAVPKSEIAEPKKTKAKAR